MENFPGWGCLYHTTWNYCSFTGGGIFFLLLYVCCGHGSTMDFYAFPLFYYTNADNLWTKFFVSMQCHRKRPSFSMVVSFFHTTWSNADNLYQEWIMPQAKTTIVFEKLAKTTMVFDGRFLAHRFCLLSMLLQFVVLITDWYLSQTYRWENAWTKCLSKIRAAYS